MFVNNIPRIQHTYNRIQHTYNRIQHTYNFESYSYYLKQFLFLPIIQRIPNLVKGDKNHTLM
jgi:hypothetical protein